METQTPSEPITRMETWRTQDKSLLSQASSEPNESELKLSGQAQKESIVDRQVNFIKQVSLSILSTNGSEYLPSGKVLSRAIEVLNDEAVAAKLATLGSKSDQQEGEEPIVASDIQDAIEANRAHIQERRMMAHMKVYEEQRNKDMQLFCVLSALSARGARR